MKINVGAEARIVGTKRVDANGSVGGMREFVGKDVLIVVPSETPRFETTARDLLAQLRTEAQRRGKSAVKEFGSFRRRHLARETRGTKTLLQWTPTDLRPAVRKADKWVRANAERLEKRATRLLAN